MASHSRDELHDDSAHADSGRDAIPSDSPRSASESGDPSAARDEPLASTDAEHAAPRPPETLKVEDEELIEMLERLNETLDTARIALSEHPTMPDLAASASGFMRGEGETAPAPVQERRSVLTPVLAAVAGIALGAGGLAMVWPVWQNREAPALQAGPADFAPRETLVSRSMQVAPPDGGEIAAIPLPEPRPAPKAIQERIPQPAPRMRAVMAANPHSRDATTDVAAAGAAAPAIQPAFADKPDFEEKDASNSMPVPDREPALAALPGKPAPPPALSPGEEAALLNRGNGYLDNGDFASARLVYEHAATRGSTEAMYTLARSYDPRFLKERNAVGIRPDRTLALAWYARAAESGHDLADEMAGELVRDAAR